MASLTKVEHIGKRYQKQLQKAGISTTEALLKNGATRKGRNQIAKESGISAKLILEWVNRADLFRISGEFRRTFLPGWRKQTPRERKSL